MDAIRNTGHAHRSKSIELMKRRYVMTEALLKRTTRFLCLLIALVVSLSSHAEPDPEKLRLASVSALVAPLGDAKPLYTKRADWVMPIASITKVMTAMVVLDSGADLGEWLSVEERHYPAPVNAFSRIRPASQATRRDLLHLALMSSENRAAYLLARHHPDGYDAFIDAMNAKARELGMSRTRFVDSSGLSDENVSTAEDLLKMVNAAHGYEEIQAHTTGAQHSVRFRSPGYSLHFGNTNPLIRSSRWNLSLSKTGYLDAAGRCLVMVADIDGQATAMIMLDSFGRRTPLGDSGRIRRWLETGNGGSVAQAALRYEQEKSQTLLERFSASLDSATAVSSLD